MKKNQELVRCSFLVFRMGCLYDLFILLKAVCRFAAPGINVLFFSTGCKWMHQ